MKNLLYILPLLLLLTNCEDPIEVNSPFEKPTVNVDAWLTNTSQMQTIKINESVDYFVGGTPPAISGATVTVCRNNDEFCATFTESTPGNYEWTPEAGTTLGEVGDSFKLEIQVRDQTITANTVLNRTAIIDSISLEREITSDDSLEIFAQLYARDLPGTGDTYWAKVWKNDTLLNRASEIILSYDGAFDAGSSIDGLYFLPPLRSIDPNDEDGLSVPYKPGDRIYAEVHSISNVAWQFLKLATEQIDNSGLFATPVSNARGNMSSSNGEEVFGIFNVAAVNAISKLVE